jgi:two-component system response regulator HydG
MEGRKLRAELARLSAAVAASRSFQGMVGASPAIQEVFELLARLESSEASVLVTGESGTGKELVARALHRASPRADGPFVTVNCAAVPESLMESELFGHAKGAFTDARSAREGLFVAASGGSLFLDEIGELPAALQPKLLRVLEERVVRPVGSNEEIPIDVRLITATNRDLETMVADGEFREDLYFRVNVVHVELPPLRARGGDVLLLARHFLERLAATEGKEIKGLSPPAAERLLAYPWPGNVRELRNCMERAVALARYDEIRVEDLPPRVREHERAQVIFTTDDPTQLLSMEEVERRYIDQVMEAVGGNKTKAARVLGFDRKTLYRKLSRRSP